MCRVFSSYYVYITGSNFWIVSGISIPMFEERHPLSLMSSLSQVPSSLTQVMWNVNIIFSLLDYSSYLSSL